MLAIGKDREEARAFARVGSAFAGMLARRANISPADAMKLTLRRGEDARQGESFAQPVNAGVALGQKVPVLDLSGMEGTGTTKELLARLKDMALKDETWISRDAEVFATLPRGKKLKHVAYSSRMPGSREARALRSNIASGMDELVQNAVLIESVPNNDPKKADILNFHRLYVPVWTDAGVQAVRIVAEELKDSDQLRPTDVELYDVVLEGQKESPAVSHGLLAEEVVPSPGAPFEITIADMLRGVKDAEGRPYVGEEYRQGSARQSPDYNPGDPQTWPPSAERDEALDLLSDIEVLRIGAMHPNTWTHDERRAKEALEIMRRRDRLGDVKQDPHTWTEGDRKDDALTYQEALREIEEAPDTWMAESPYKREAIEAQEKYDDEELARLRELEMERIQEAIDELREAEFEAVADEMNRLDDRYSALEDKESGVMLAEAEDLQERLNELIAAEEKAGQDAEAYNQIAYNGSPALYDRFDMSKVGSGNGTASYGWGANLSSARDVAKMYALLAGGDAESVQVAKFDIPEDDVLLARDKRFSEQPQKVKDALQPYADEYKQSDGERGIKIYDVFSGAQIQEKIADALNEGRISVPGGLSGPVDETSREVSMFLNGLGIPGLRYPDDGGNGYDFVIWDENVIHMLEREGGGRTETFTPTPQPSARQSEDYDPGDPKTWPEGPARDEALTLEAWQHLEDDDEVETWPESPEKAEALALQKEYREIEAWVEGHSVEEVLANDELNERGVHIEERLRDLRRDLRKKKPKGAAKRLSQLIEAEEEAAAREAQEAENARIDAEDAEEYYQSAYHGSPHKFDRFSLENVGTGEGTGNQGYGLYFAEDENTANWYRRRYSAWQGKMFDVKAAHKIDGNSLYLYIDGDENGYTAKSRTGGWKAKNGEKASKELNAILKTIAEYTGSLPFDSIYYGRDLMLPIYRLGKVNQVLSTELNTRRRDIEKDLATRDRASIIKLYGDKDIDEDFIRAEIKRWNNIDKRSLKRIEAAQEFLRRHEIRDVHPSIEINEKAGSLHLVDIPDDDVLLLWDSPLSEQSEKVRNALKDIIKHPEIQMGLKKAEEEAPGSRQKLEETLNNFESGKLLYFALARLLKNKDTAEQAMTLGRIPGDTKRASALLNSLGIKGDKWRDEKTWTSGNGKYNFVIWDDDAIKMLETYYQQQLKIDPIASKYVKETESSRNVPIDKLHKTEPLDLDAAERARQKMQEAEKGGREKRSPLIVADRGDGTYSIIDGNNTFENLRELGARNVPVTIVPAPYQKHVTNLESLYARNAEVQTEFSDLLRSWQDEVGGELKMRKKLKSEERIREKVEADYNGKYQRVLDVLAGSLVFDSAEQMTEAFDKLKDKAEVVRIKDKWTHPDSTGYRDVNLNIRLSNGTLAELQLHHRGIMEAKNGLGHLLYEFIRKNKAKDEMIPFTRQAEEISRAVYDAGLQGKLASRLANSMAQALDIGRRLSSQTSTRGPEALLSELSGLILNTFSPASSESMAPDARNSTANGTSSPFSKYRNKLNTSVGMGKERSDRYRTDIPQSEEKINARLTVQPDGMSLIDFFESANKSTSFHELAHHVFRMLDELSRIEGADSQLRADVDEVLKHAGVTREDFDSEDADVRRQARTQAHEYFAQGFETYIAEGKAPSRALRGVFRRLRAWMIEVYHDVVQALGIELSPEMRDIYARLLATPEEITAETTVQELAVENAAIKEEIKRYQAELRERSEQEQLGYEASDDWSFYEVPEDAEEAVIGWLGQLEEYEFKHNAREAVQNVARLIRENGGLRFGDFIVQLGEDLARDVRRRWPGLFRNTTDGPQLTLDVLTETLQAHGINLDVQGLVDWLQENVNEVAKKPAPLVEINTDTLNALVEHLGVDGAREYMTDRRRYLTRLQKALQAEYDQDKSNAQVKADLEATYREQREIAESVKALDRTLSAEGDVAPERTMEPVALGTESGRSIDEADSKELLY